MDSMGTPGQGIETRGVADLTPEFQYRPCNLEKSPRKPRQAYIVSPLSSIRMPAQINTNTIARTRQPGEQLIRTRLI